MAAGLGAAALLGAVGCQPEPGPPAGTIVSATATPGVAGQLVTVSILASHPAGMDRYTVGGIDGPDGARYPGSADPDGCFPQGWITSIADPQPNVATELSFTCRLPANMLNGTWNVTVWVTAGFNTTSSKAVVPIVVTGGVDDAAGPVVTFLAPNGQRVARGQAFGVDYRIQDPNIAPNDEIYASWFERKGPFIPYSSFLCPAPTNFQRTVVDATTLDISFSCVVPGNIEPGDYTAYPQYASDVYGHRTHIPLTLVVT